MQLELVVLEAPSEPAARMLKALDQIDPQAQIAAGWTSSRGLIAQMLAASSAPWRQVMSDIQKITSRSVSTRVAVVYLRQSSSGPG